MKNEQKKGGGGGEQQNQQQKKKHRLTIDFLMKVNSYHYYFYNLQGRRLYNGIPLNSIYQGQKSYNLNLSSEIIQPSKISQHVLVNTCLVSDFGRVACLHV